MSRLPPTGTVTLLLADVEESTHLWQMCPEDMATAIAHLDHTVSEAITNHGGVQPVKRYEGDSFVAAFTRASVPLHARWICSGPRSRRSDYV